MNGWVEIITCLAPLSMFLAAFCIRMLVNVVGTSSWTSSRQQDMIVLSYVFIGIGFIALAFTSIVIGWTVVLLFLMCFILLIQSLCVEAAVAARRRLTQQAELLWLLATTLRSHGNLADAVEAYAFDAHGDRRIKLLNLVASIRTGTSPTELAVPQGLLPDSAMLEVQAGLRSGSLHDALRRAAIRQTRETVEMGVSGNPGLSALYPIAIMTAASLMIGFLMYYIVPKFKRIFEDFGTELPTVTISLIQLSDLFVNYGYIAIPLIYLFIAAALVVLWIQYQGWRATMQWILGGWVVRVYTPELLRALSLSIAAQQSLDDALKGILSSGAARLMKTRIAALRSQLVEGNACWAELGQQGFLNSREVALLNSAEKVGNLPWTLVAMGDAIERRWVFQILAFAGIYEPMSIVALGIFVGFVAMAFFMPLVKLLNDLS